jgi:hypothetical protein
MFSPSFIARMAMNRLHLGMSVIAITALAIFIVGVILLLKVVKD